MNSAKCGTKKGIASAPPSGKHRPHPMEGDRKFKDINGHLWDNSRVRVFTTMLMRAWRSRGEEVKEMAQRVDNYKKWAVKVENKIHIYNTLYAVERKRNESLETHLKETLQHMGLVRNTCESLTLAVANLKADKAGLEQRLRTKQCEFDALTTILGQAKSDLFRSLETHRCLQKSLVQERQSSTLLQSEKNKLIEEVCQLRLRTRHVEEQFRLELAKKNEEVLLSRKRVDELESRVEVLNRKELLLKEARYTETRLRLEIVALQEQVAQLRTAIDDSIVYKLQALWKNLLSTYQRKTTTIGHLFAFYLLPATPPPCKIAA